MIQKDKMFQLVINNPKLVSAYNYNPSDYPDCASGLESDNAVVVSVAMMVGGISSDLASAKPVDEKGLYQKVFSHLNENLIYAD